MSTRRTRFLVGVLAVVVVACLDNSLGPSTLTVTLAAGSADTVWSGTPGEAIPGGVRVRIVGEGGRPISGASLAWEAVGRGSRLANAAVQSNSAGEGTAVWLLGTDAAEEQRLHVIVRAAHQEADVVVRARVVPNVVSGLRVVADTAGVLRVGDTLQLHVDAIDPYGNVFPAPDVTTTLSDSTLGSAVGALVIGGPRRGRGVVRVTSRGVGATLPLHVTQFVAAIVPAHDTLVFSSLGAEVPIAYEVRDDRGRVVADTVAALSVSDTSVARLDGTRLRSLSPGDATLQFELSPANALIPLTVDQRIASLRLIRDTIRFDALFDTTTIHPIARDSLGFYVRQPAVIIQVQDEQVAELAARTLTAVTPGVTIVTLVDPETGITTSAAVVVHQLIRRIDAGQVLFDALGDELTPAVTARDRLGFAVANAALVYAISDSTVVHLGPDGRLNSLRPGQVTLSVRDPETGTVTSTDVIVQQRIATLALDADTVAFDALSDTARFSLVGRDRLGALVADAGERTVYVSTDSQVIAVSASGIAQSAGNGAALVIAQSSDGPSDTVRVVVAQRVTALVVNLDSVLFESLQAEQHVTGTAVDRLGIAVAGVPVTYSVEDTTIVRLDQTGITRALSNGATRVIASVEAITVPVTIRVQQRAVRVVVPQDTIHLSALGDTASIAGVALDSLGSRVLGDISGLVIGDSSVISQTDSLTVRAKLNGTARVTFSIAGVRGSTNVAVKQVAASMTAAVVHDPPIVTLAQGQRLELDCHVFDRNAFEIEGAEPVVASSQGTVNGSRCDGITIVHSGHDVLHVSLDTSSRDVPVTIAVQPSVTLSGGEYLNIDSFPENASPWSPSVWRNPSGQVELFVTVYYPDSSTQGTSRGDLHRYVSDDGLVFRYDGVVLQKDADPCSLNGSGIENVAIVPRQGGIGWRMFYAGGTFNCYGWQVFSAVSEDGRNWIKEPGIRLSNGGSIPPAAPVSAPYPVGEGMSVDVLPSGETRMIVGSFEHVDPPPDRVWQIAEWRSSDQLNWHYLDVVLTTRDMPRGGQGSVYSPSIIELAPGLWRMFFTADDRLNPNSRSAVWTAVSTDRKNWTVEGRIAGDSTTDLYYASVLDSRLYFIRQDVGGGARLASATLQMR
jgi:hypothetical protein